jgi:ferrous iron transport protein B
MNRASLTARRSASIVPVRTLSTAVASRLRSVVVIGKESTGKSQLLASLTGSTSRAANFNGSTVSCEIYRHRDVLLVDTPGIHRTSDSQTTRLALEQLEAHDTVLLVAQATHLDDDLTELLPLAAGRRGAVVVTFWDKLAAEPRARAALDALNQESGIPFVPVDARHLSPDDCARITAAIAVPATIRPSAIRARAGWRVEPRVTWLDRPGTGVAGALLLIVLPPVAAAWAANTFAERIDAFARAGLGIVPSIDPTAPTLADAVLFGRYGLITMGPLLFVWAAPTVAFYALLLGIYKASGLLDRLTSAIHPVTRSLGLSGRDLVRVIMGFGCNVPAVVSTRSCSSCSRSTCVSVIAFGSACSYQYGATLAVFAAARAPLLAAWYLLYLTATALLYSRLTASRAARSTRNLLVIDRRVFLTRPRVSAVWNEARITIRQFFLRALPVFAVLTIAASIVDWSGGLNRAAAAVRPLMAPFNLPEAAALPLILSCVRKDGILLFSTDAGLQGLTRGQLLTGVYLAGVFAPCLVTLLTIAREMSARFALLLLARQVTFAVACAAVLGQICRALGV